MQSNLGYKSFGTMTIVGKFLFEVIPLGNFTFINSQYMYNGPYIRCFSKKRGVITCKEFTYRGRVLRCGDNLSRHGDGITTFSNGDHEIGVYQFDVVNPTHKIIKSDGTILEGIFKDGLLDTGTILCPNRDIIEMTNGLAKIMKTNKHIFTGCLYKNYQMYHGKLTRHNGDIYDGHWTLEGEFTGTAKLRNFTGLVLFTRDMTGTFKLGDLILEGFVSNGTFEGFAFDSSFKGKITYPNGDIYEGEFSNGKRNGKGILVTNEITYDCNWFNDLKQGAGDKIENGVRVFCVWENDKLI